MTNVVPFDPARAVAEREQATSGPLESGSGGGNDGRMEARVAKLEAHVEHIRSDVAEIKGDVRSLRSALDSRFLWMISAFGAGFLTLAGLMAKGFGWI